ncbi:MAG: hypothetical protein IJV93_02055 [Lentisphaeria bacterium]|nr:hypothetical protein [Lentisphaeria bacterium]
MKDKRIRQRGQATTEMVFMLLGFVILLLGIIFTLSLEIFNTRVLLDSKYRTERSVHFDNASLNSGAGKEIKGWDYENGIPFTLNDRAAYGSAGEMTESEVRLGSDVDSRTQDYAYEWVRTGGFSKGGFKADFRGRDQSSVSAANLISRQGDAVGYSLAAKFPELHTALANLLGLKINYDKLRNNPSNRVYLPANGEL